MIAGTDEQETPLEAILHHDLRDARSEDLDDLYRFVRYCESGDKTYLSAFTLDQLDLLFARYGAIEKPHIRALIVYREELRDARANKISRREKVGLAMLAMLLGVVGGALTLLIKSFWAGS